MPLFLFLIGVIGYCVVDELMRIRKYDKERQKTHNETNCNT